MATPQPSLFPALELVNKVARLMIPIDFPMRRTALHFLADLAETTVHVDPITGAKVAPPGPPTIPALRNTTDNGQEDD
jgi:hypothetical protein